MNRFGYWRDPLCLLAIAAYALNRWGLAPHVHWSFLHTHGDDLFLIPAALPLVLWIQRHLRLRQHDQFPTTLEILFHLVVWSIVCEGIGPRIMPHCVGDPYDVLAYAAGAIGAGLWWHYAANRTAPAT